MWRTDPLKLPIRIRLALIYCAAFCVLFGALEAAAWWSVRAAIHSIVDHELETRLAGLQDHIGRHLERFGWPELSASLQNHPAFQPNLLFVRKSSGPGKTSGTGKTSGPGKTSGEVVFSNPWAKRVALPNTAGFATVDSPGHALRVLLSRVTFDHELYDVICATDLWIPATILRRLWLWMLLSLPAVLLAASAAGYWISGRALRPVSGIIAAVNAIDSTNLGQRIAVPSTGDEVQALAETMNGMLVRVEEGFRQVRQFTDNASHELRTPIAIIRAAAEIALLKPGAEERSYRDALHRILRQAERNSVLIEQLLELARADAGAIAGQAIRRTSVDLAASLSHACSEIAPLAAEKGLRLNFQAASAQASPPLFVDADEDRLRRLWLILLDNAVKYTPEGGEITARTLRADGRLCCEVADTGIGIGAEHLGRIFERFYRVDKARSRETRRAGQSGAGLGLAIACEIARLHGARIEAKSSAGGGSRFLVLFPAPSPDGIPQPSGNPQVPLISLK